MMELREVWCRWPACGRWFCLCRACDRGHRYCSDLCRALGAEASKRKARRTYAKSKKGRKNNRKRQQRHRDRKREVLERLRRSSNDAQSKKTSPRVTDRTSQAVLDALEWLNAKKENLPNSAQILVVRAGRAEGEQRVSTVAKRSSEPGQCGTFACCHRCGRPGRVVRRRRPRGRFRWVDPKSERRRRQRE
jgi:hypothetical protein